MYSASVRNKKLFLVAIVAILTLWYFYSLPKSDFGGRHMISMKTLLIGAIRASEIGGLQIVEVHENPKFMVASKGKTKEGVNDPVTEADYRSHCAMYDSLTKAFPKMMIISEEKSVGCKEDNIANLENDMTELSNVPDVMVDIKDITVWIDPLDATKEFTENLLQYVTTMVCVAYKGEPVIGVIHKPFKPKSTYWAWVDHKVSDNLKDRSEPLEEDGTPVLIVSRSHAGEVENSSKIAFGKNVKIVSAAGAGYKTLEVILGNATAYVHMTAIKKWDICAGAAILSAMGGSMTPLFGPPKINFEAKDSTVLDSGLLATMKDHNWYLDKFSNL